MFARLVRVPDMGVEVFADAVSRLEFAPVIGINTVVIVRSAALEFHGQAIGLIVVANGFDVGGFDGVEGHQGFIVSRETWAATFRRRYHVRRDMPTALHGLVAANAKGLSFSKGRPRRTVCAFDVGVAAIGLDGDETGATASADLTAPTEPFWVANDLEG